MGRTVRRFSSIHKRTKKKKKLFVIGVALHLLSLACFYSIPLFLTYSLHDYTSLTLINSMVASAYVLIIGAFVPIPGATVVLSMDSCKCLQTFYQVVN